MSILNKKCVPCEGGVLPLQDEQIADLKKEINESWIVNDGNTIKREFVFKNFRQALSFVNEVGDISEFEGHHPDIFIHDYKKVLISLSTHSINGLSENDFILALKIDEIELNTV